MIGAGGVATVAAFKIVQNQDVFTEFMIASRRKENAIKLVKDIHAKGYKMDIQTAEVDADDVEQLKALFNSYKPELVINLALPYQDLTIMDACLACGCNYMDTANYEPLRTRLTSSIHGSGHTRISSNRQVSALSSAAVSTQVYQASSPLMQPSITSMRLRCSTSWIATPVTITRLSQPTSTQKSISARLPRRDSGIRMANGLKPTHCLSTSLSPTLTSVLARAIWCTTRSWRAWWELPYHQGGTLLDDLSVSSISPTSTASRTSAWAASTKSNTRLHWQTVLARQPRWRLFLCSSSRPYCLTHRISARTMTAKHLSVAASVARRMARSAPTTFITTASTRRLTTKPACRA